MKQLKIHPLDNVAVDIETGHKKALVDIPEGANVVKYGFPIGHATKAIKKGEIGIRNDIWIINTVGCVNKIAEKLSALTGALCFTHPYGCSQLGDELAEQKSNWIDFNAGPMLEGKELSGELLNYVMAVASGEQTKNEKNGYREIAIFKDGVTL